MKGNPLLWMSGADLDVLQHCQRERRKFVAMGGTIVTTSVFATVGATFTMHQFLHASLLLSLIVGLGWGLAIMNLDRWLMISIRRQGTPTKTVLIAVPRVILALLIGLVIAEPLVLWVFNEEVMAQAEEDQGHEYEDGVKRVQQLYPVIPTLKAKEKHLQESLGAVHEGAELHRSVAYNDALDSLRRVESSAAKGRLSPAEQAQLQAEAESRVDEVRSGVLATEAQHAKKKRGYRERKLHRAQRELSQQLKRRREAIAKLDVAYDEIGLLDRVEALGHLTSQHPEMLAIRIVLTLVILLIDSLPALAKVLMSLGRESLYEENQNRLEAADAAALAQQTEAFAKAGEISAGLVVEEAETHRAYAKDVQDDLLRRAVDVMREAGEKFVERWRTAVLGSVDDLVDEELKRSGLRPAKSNDGQPKPPGPNGDASKKPWQPPSIG